jgi:hypothetical protein
LIALLTIPPGVIQMKNISTGFTHLDFIFIFINPPSGKSGLDADFSGN